MAKNSTGVAIIGGGLAGLALADHLQRSGVDCQVFEARDRLGGRVESANCLGATFDLGPAWFWSIQPRMLKLCQRLRLPVFEQHSAGDLLFEDAERRVHRGAGYASMEGSLRIEGGASALINALARGLPQERLHLGTPVREVVANGQITLADRSLWQAERIVLAVPPRIAAELHFEPALDPRQRQLLTDIPTWMAGHAKLVAVYDEPFWRTDGLSGDAMSRSGPLMELHDASPQSGQPGALFGFYGVPAQVRRDHRDELIQASLAQLGRLYGVQAERPVQTFLRDWALESEIATQADHQPPPNHPVYGLPQELNGLWDGRLLFAASEMAPRNGGFMEGALEQAEAVAQQLLRTH
ncbi:flavin-dependent amine oxidoreductase [Halospina denitrificans]|uniref:Flavin-dependent amine oxidoreductase n=1 Tax=Halospina denitrificans TaxID=332522 RepID=A0A4R7JT19_9GAMM|nr:FAD-dependent oxidoreductase [Halospina denitrificans]TDT41451.1 flavin-dependent amine oxidoreductase [Halospina denitrificans]